MSAVVFLGPTLSLSEARVHLAADFRPPVAQGDVYRAARDGARAIGIVDGYFDRVPAVWHKEILWALRRGVAIYGSASMGALRAAELSAYGMLGIGAVFESLRSGALEDDDEVAVAHADAERGYRPLSEAMVNIRATLVRARGAGVLTPLTVATLLEIARATFYAERTYPMLLARGLEAGLDPAELNTFREWLSYGKVNQKQEDAVAMLRRMQADATAGVTPAVACFRFAHTDAWEMVMREANAALDRCQEPPSPVADETSLEAFLQEEIQLFSPYALVRALRKQRALASMVVDDAVARDAVDWYFRTRLHRTVPEDLEQFARDLGMADARAFERAVRREFEFVRKHTGQDDAGGVSS